MVECLKYLEVKEKLCDKKGNIRAWEEWSERSKAAMFSIKNVKP